MDPERLAFYNTPAVLSLVLRIQAGMRGLLQRARCSGHGAHAEEERSLPTELRRGALMGERSPRGSPRRLGHMSTSRHLSSGAVLGTRARAPSCRPTDRPVFRRVCPGRSADGCRPMCRRWAWPRRTRPLCRRWASMAKAMMHMGPRRPRPDAPFREGITQGYPETHSEEPNRVHGRPTPLFDCNPYNRR